MPKRTPTHEKLTRPRLEKARARRHVSIVGARLREAGLAVALRI
jgi:hypothetical protein